MIFSTSPFYKILVAGFIIIGTGLLIILFHDFGELEDEQKKTAFLWFLMFAVFFFGIPFYAIKYFKNIERNNGVWTVNYPYLNKNEFVFSEKNIRKILISEEGSGSHTIWHTIIKIKLRNGSSLSIRSYETRNFKKMLELIEKDFKGTLKKNF